MWGHTDISGRPQCFNVQGSIEDLLQMRQFSNEPVDLASVIRGYKGFCSTACSKSIDTGVSEWIEKGWFRNHSRQALVLTYSQMKQAVSSTNLNIRFAASSNRSVSPVEAHSLTEALANGRISPMVPTSPVTIPSYFCCSLSSYSELAPRILKAEILEVLPQSPWSRFRTL